LSGRSGGGNVVAMNDAVRVLPWPYWTGNPYLPRFCDELEACGGVAVIRTRFRPLALRQLGRGDWLHLHWPGDLLRSPDRRRYGRRIAGFLRALDRLRGRGVRVCWTAHNLVPHDDPHPDLGLEARRAMVARLDHVLIHFATAGVMLEDELGWRGPTTVIPHGHYADVYGGLADPVASRRAIGAPGHGLILLMLGQLRPYKGIAAAVAAFQRIATGDDRLIVAGRPEGDVAVELAAARADDRIVVRAERIPAAELAGYHAAADAVLLAYRASFTSGAAVMALSLGCPAVGAGGPHLASLGPEPRVFAADRPDPASLAAAIERRRAHGPIDRAALRAWARTHLSWSAAARRAAAVFRGAPAAVPMPALALARGLP
jgi:beta-1,4-mannosyltransferase